MNLDLDREILIEGVARGVERLLERNGFAEQVRATATILEKLHFLKEGLLTGDQVCFFLQITRRTLDRWVEEGKLRKETSLGDQLPRFFLMDVIDMLRRGHITAKCDLPELPLLDLVENGRVHRRNLKTA